IPKLVHWSLSNGSGLNRMATMICQAETEMGLDSFLCYTDGGVGKPTPGVRVLPDKEVARDADIHVIHSHVPDDMPGKKVMIPHGTPEHCFRSEERRVGKEC